VRQHDRVLAAGEEQNRTFELRRNLAQHVNRLGFQLLQVGAAVGDAHARGRERVRWGPVDGPGTPAIGGPARGTSAGRVAKRLANPAGQDILPGKESLSAAKDRARWFPPYGYLLDLPRETRGKAFTTRPLSRCHDHRGVAHMGMLEKASAVPTNLLMGRILLIRMSGESFPRPPTLANETRFRRMRLNEVG
jgi:hypothetical protein